MNILVIEDDERIASFICRGLREAGFAVSHAADGEDGYAYAATGAFDAAIVDLMLPKMDGLTLIEELRREGMRMPVLILSAKRTVDDRIRGLRAGGDDYMVKPFAFAELIARIHALIRRSTGGGERTLLQVADLCVDLLKRTVRRGNTPIDLQPREFSLLEYLMRHEGRVIPKTEIMEHVWGYDFDPQTNVVESRVCRLRDKVDKGFSLALIHTVRGMGYVLAQDR